MNTPKFNQPQLTGWKQSPKYPLMYCTTRAGKIRVWACWVKGNTVYRTDGLIDGKLKEPQSHMYEGNTLRSGEEQSPLEAEKMWLKQFGHDYRPADDDAPGQKVAKHVQQQKEQNGGMNRGVKLFGATEITSKTTAGKKDLGRRHYPMLAKKYKDWKKIKGDEEFCFTNPGKAIKFPAIAQAKVDGIRVLPQLTKNGTVSLESRNGNSFVHLDHLRDEIKYWLERKGYPDMILDGEMYVHTLYRDDSGKPTLYYPERDVITPEEISDLFSVESPTPIDEIRERATQFGCKNSKRLNKSKLKDFLIEFVPDMPGVERYQFISEACKITRSKPHEYEDLVEFWVFDLWDPKKTNMERWKLLQKIFSDYDGDIIKLVPTKIVNSHDEIEDYMEEFVGESTGRESYEFEGLMVRQAEAGYEARNNYHSSQLLKYKRFEDEEWEVYGAEKCNGGTQDGAVKWLCQKEIKGKLRKVIAKQVGDTETSKKLYNAYLKNPKKYINKMINIRFNDRTRDGVPRFPRATAFPEDK